MTSTLRDLMRWSVKPAENVDTATTPKINVLRGLAARATTPLLPDDYLKLLNPLWTARELRGEIVDVRTETEDSATVTIKPGWGFSADYRPGPVRRHRPPCRRPVALAVVLADLCAACGIRSASRSPSRRHPKASCPAPGQRRNAGNDRSAGGAQGRLRASRPAAAEDPVRQCRQRHHPGDGDAAFAEARGQRPDIVHIHSAPTADAVIFHDELRELGGSATRLPAAPAAHP